MQALGTVEAPVPGAGDEGDAPGVGTMRSLHGLQCKSSCSQDDYILRPHQQYTVLLGNALHASCAGALQKRGQTAPFPSPCPPGPACTPPPDVDLRRRPRP